MTTGKYTEEELTVASLIIDHRIQRSVLDTSRVVQIVKNFNPDALDRISVSRRENGDQVILDGWHRFEAVRRITEGKGFIPARVFEGLTLQEEARLFLQLNFKNPPKYFDAWKVRLVEGEPMVVSITETLKSFGWEIDMRAGNGKINGIRAIERIQRLSDELKSEPGLVHATILVITRAWGRQTAAGQGSMFEGLGRFLAEYGPRLDLARLIDKLKLYPGGPETFLRQARNLASIRQMRTPMAVADQLTELYNKDFKIGGRSALPVWSKRK